MQGKQMCPLLGGVVFVYTGAPLALVPQTLGLRSTTQHLFLINWPLAWDDTVSGTGSQALRHTGFPVSP